jgi:hypothetical protein
VKKQVGEGRDMYWFESMQGDEEKRQRKRKRHFRNKKSGTRVTWLSVLI